MENELNNGLIRSGTKNNLNTQYGYVTDNEMVAFFEEKLIPEISLNMNCVMNCGTSTAEQKGNVDVTTVFEVVFIVVIVRVKKKTVSNKPIL